MVAVTGRVRLIINVGEALGVGEVARFAQRQIQGNGILVGIKCYGIRNTQYEICLPFAPVGVRGDFGPVSEVEIGEGRRRGVGEFVVTEGGEGLPRAVDEGFDEFEPLGDFFGGEAGFMVHRR